MPPEVRQRRLETERSRYRQIVREKVAGAWFAALVSTREEDLNEIQARFETWKGLQDFIIAHEAVVDLWAYGDRGTRNGRRVPAWEVADLRRKAEEQPLYVTVTYREPNSGAVVTQRIEFGFGAAEVAFQSQQAYSAQRRLQATARRILSAQAAGKFSVVAQRRALEEAVQDEGLQVTEMPVPGGNTNDLFVAVEYELDQANYINRVRCFWRESEILPRVVREPAGTYVQVLQLKSAKTTREVRAFKLDGTTDQLKPVRSPLLGQDSIELRIVPLAGQAESARASDPRTWNVLEFGEPALVRQASVAEFSLINAYLEKRRKEVGLIRSKFNLFAEPVFAGLNIGCGLAGVGVPVGEAARLGYNAAITPWLIPPVPSVKQMRELMRLVAAREKVPELKTRPARFLNAADFQLLKRKAASISEADLDAYMQRIQDEDVQAMLRLAKMGNLDQEVSNLLNILTEAAKVSGWSDEPGLQRDLLNSVYFSVNGDINIKNIIAVLAGARNTTPLAGISLHDLAHGGEPQIAWLQFLDGTVDVRAVANTISRLMRSDRANKELKMPFPYATRMSDIAAYEIRIFGYPLFMYYKRGLLKNDYAAYQNDYAYGLITTRIVEHFRTREEMEEEIRAGRMMPLGFVRVPAAKGGWKESNLAVFAHRIPRGKHAGKTAIIIYGLRAYAEQSRLMQREYQRLKKFEQALREGGVIEQIVDADANTSHSLLPDPGFEPVIHVGTNTASELFSPLLGNLLEWRRHVRRSAWGLELSPSETNALAEVRRTLESRGVSADLAGPDPLLGLDRYSSSFLYRKNVNGRWCTVKMVNIPAPNDIVRELHKAAQAREVEEVRRRGVSAEGQGLALLSSVRWIKDPEPGSTRLKAELGPLLRDQTGHVQGAGVRSDREGLDRLFDQIARLPVTERAKLQAQDYAASRVELDVDDKGRKQEVFVTIEFPIAEQFERTSTNTLTGETERLLFENARVVRTVGPRSIIEFDYESGTESASRTFFNRGTVAEPIQGALLEETRTLEAWHYDLRESATDPYRVRTSKLRANHITGTVSREDFGLFNQPVWAADDLYVISNRFNLFGFFSHAQVSDNVGGSVLEEAQSTWNGWAALLRPVAGKARFEISSQLPELELEALRDGRSTAYQTVVRKLDLVKGTSRIQVFNNSFDGRLENESWTEPLMEQAEFPWFSHGDAPGPGRNDPESGYFGPGHLLVPMFQAPAPPLPTALEVTVNREYRDEFCKGMVPLATRKVVAGNELLRTRTLSYDPLTRRLLASEGDYTGAARTNVWDYRWESPITIETAGRKTDIEFNRDETFQTSTTIATSTGEAVATGSGEFDPSGGVWRVGRTDWYRPGITNRVATETRTGFGLLLASQTADLYLSQPVYEFDGVERSTRVFRRNHNSGAFDRLHRVEENYIWQRGRRAAQVQTYADGLPYDRFGVISDEMGRTSTDGIREYPGLRLLTRITYEGDSERVARAEEVQNGQLRLVRVAQREQAKSLSLPETGWELPMTVTPRWGLVSTQLFVLGDPLGRPILQEFENGDKVQVREWYPESTIPRVSELVKPDGRIVERTVTTVSHGTNGMLPYDLTERYRMSFWGGAGLAAKEASVRGTDLALFTEVADERTYFDLHQPLKAPLYAVDPHGYVGVAATIEGVRHTNVCALFRTQLEKTGAGDSRTNGQPAGPKGEGEILHVERADLRGFFFQRVTGQKYDRSGRLLEELVSRAPNAGDASYRDETVFDVKRISLARFKPEYQTGWFVEAAQGTRAGTRGTDQAGTAGRWLFFTNQPPPAGSRGYRVNKGAFPDTITATEGKVFGSTGESEAAKFRDFFYRRIHNLRFFESNPHMPGTADYWSASTRTDFGQDGSHLFDLELVFDAQGRLRVARAEKTTSSGAPGTRISYQAAEPQLDGLKVLVCAPGRNSLPLQTSGRTDFTGSDFLYLYQSGGPAPQLVVTDGSGRRATVRRGDSDFGAGIVPAWRVHPMHVRWLPDDIEPQQGTDLTAPAWLHRSGYLLPVSVQDLVRAKLNVRNLRSFELQFTNERPVRLSISAVFALDRQGGLIKDSNRREYSVAEIQHSSGLRSIVTTDRARTERDFYSGQKTDVLVEFNGLPVATARARGPLAGFPNLLWLDNSDPDVARPLYAMSGDDGHFLEYYQMLRPGDTHLYVAPETFEVPRLETYRAAVLHDELYAGRTGYGRDYRLSIPITRASGFLGRVRATVRNRVEANLFCFAADQALQRVSGNRPGDGLRRFDYLRFQEAETRGREIKQQPAAAQVLVNLRDVPWPSDVRDEQSGVPVDWEHLRTRLLGRHITPTGLIPTSPYTEAARFVDTVKEADLIVLAVRLGQPAIAAALLDFYRKSSRGGQQALLSSYDAETGNSMKTDVRSKRPRQSEATAEAQLAIAEAAFWLALENPRQTNSARETRNSAVRDRDSSQLENQGFVRSEWATFGRDLLELTLKQFRPNRQPDGRARGICEYRVDPRHQIMGLTMWPDANTYLLASNARAYLLLKRLGAIIRSRFQDPEWELQLVTALREQEDFLKGQVLPEVERTGVVPAGLFEIQDIEQQSTSITIQRWTTAEDWLWFLEAAAEMGIAPEKCQRWLENLARVHGVQVRGVWGLDWRLAVLREDAISTELTARFFTLAKRLGHQPARTFAARNLQAMRWNDLFPVTVTEAPPTHALAGSRGFSVHPWANVKGWPPSIAIFRDLLEKQDFGHDLAVGPPGAPVMQRAAATAMVEGSTPKARPLRRLASGIGVPLDPTPRQKTDLMAFVLIAAGVYGSVLGSALFWWALRTLRRRHSPSPFSDPLVTEEVMQRAEERWAKRVLGLRTVSDAERWRFSNAPVEQNFLVQLRAVYKLVLEWRRLENGWAKDDERLVESSNDSWLNGADEFAALIGIYMRAVIKAGSKDGFKKPDVLAENEDSNHIWARLTLFFSEHLWSLEAALDGWQKSRGGPAQDDYRAEVEQTLDAMGIRERLFGFDARELFDFPVNPDALDLLIIQDPKRSLTEVMQEASLKLDIPLDQIRKVVEQYKQFKIREQPYPVHPYLVEMAKELPHFVLMALGAIVAYNQRIGDSPIVEYLKSIVTKLLLAPESLLWAAPLIAGMALSLMARFQRVYRFEAAIRPRRKPSFLLDSTVTSIFVKRHEAEPKQRSGAWRDANAYERWGWILRAAGYLVLALSLFRLETPSFGTFLIVKGIFAMLALAEVAAVLLPLTGIAVSMFVQDRVHRHPAWARLNRLNITATRPASPIWLSIKYHAQPSMPTGTWRGLFQAVAFYFVLAAAFFFGAGFLCQQIFSLWFTETYLQASNLKLLIGGGVFALTMVLLRYGLFLLFTSIASMLAVFPLLSIAGLAAISQLVLTYFGPDLDLDMNRFAPAFWGIAALVIGYGLLGKRTRTAEHGGNTQFQARDAKVSRDVNASGKDGRLAVVYMSGDDVSALKLTPDLLMARWTLLRDRLDSNVVPILAQGAGKPDDQTLRAWFQQLYDAERGAGVTLWHPLQLRVQASGPAAPHEGHQKKKQCFLPPELGLHITVSDEQQRLHLVVAWHIRRWLAGMMSTGGHSQDTGINLVDMALRFHQEGLSEQLAFYLIQNKYDNSSHNRPSQIHYSEGEMGQRNKLARLLCVTAPGARAYCLQNWTPFGFKAGGLTGMDLVYEESLQLSSMLLLDRNATVHDLDALMLDVREAMADPNLIIVIPGRSTTNTLTPVGQGSQLVEEGHRSFLRGLLSWLGGSASEALGTGWGNLLACFYGRVQRALVSAGGRKMPLTSRMLRGASFAERTEGLIGFGPHAVGISEDIWAVVQATNTALGLGLRPRFALSRAIWHKVRETWSHAEWLSSFPRWAGGYFQMVHDPLMQRIYDFGPQSVFARELRSNSGRNFLSAPVALLSILLMPLSIIFDVSPFVQTLVVLWNCGFVLNQVLTLHALNMYLESCGFYRLTALIGTAAGVALSWLLPVLQAYRPGMVMLGFLMGGFFVGFNRWLVTRVRDLLLFGPQLVLHALAQTVRLSLEFTVSGTSPEDARRVNVGFRAWAGPREDRPLERFPGCINLRTVVWAVGICSLLLCLLALTRLDMLNVLLLLPSLLFSISTVAGPFLMSPAPGKPLGAWTIIPRGLGWITALLFYTVVSVCASHGPTGRWIAVVLFILMFGSILRHALRYIGFRYAIRRCNLALQRLLGSSGNQSAAERAESVANRQSARKLSETILQACASDPVRIRQLLEQSGLTAEQRQQVSALAQNRIVPLLGSPMKHMTNGLLARSRWLVEYTRALVLAVLVLLWIFLVPVPGLMVFTAGSYRFALPLGKILAIIPWGIATILAGYWIGRVIQWLDLRGRGAAGLQARLERCFTHTYSRLTGLASLPDAEAAGAFALITDAQTYIDQRSYAFARRAIEAAEKIVRV